MAPAVRSGKWIMITAETGGDYAMAGCGFRAGALEPVCGFCEVVRERRREFESLVLAEAMLDHAGREEAARDPAPHVVARRNRQESPRVVVEPDGVVEARGLDRLFEEPQHSLVAVVEPPRRPEPQRGVMPGERRKFARVGGLVEREQDQREIALVAVAVEKRLQCTDVI